MPDRIGNRAGPSRRSVLGFSAAAGAVVLLGSGCDAAPRRTVTLSTRPDVTRLRALFMKQARYSEANIRDMTAAFQVDNPGIEVEPTLVEPDALHDTITNSARTAAYDVVLVDATWPAELGSRNLLADITARVSGSEIEPGMLSDALHTARYRNRLYGLPWILDTKYLYFNQDHLRRAGVDPESLSTWAGVAAAAKTIRRRGVAAYPLAWSWRPAEDMVCDYTQLLGAFGGQFLTSDGRDTLFQVGGGLAALEFMVRTLRTDHTTDPASTGWGERDVTNQFSAGKASIALNWTDMYAAANNSATSRVAGRVSIVPTPMGPGGNPGVNGSMALCVTAASKNQDAAWKYVRHLTSAATQNRYVASSPPGWAGSYTDNAVVRANPDVVPVAREQLGNLISRPELPRYHELSGLLQTAIHQALLGRGTPEQTLSVAASRAQALLT